MSKKSERKLKRTYRRRTEFSTLHSDCKCIFCGTTEGLQQHHICQKRFNGPDTEDNKVWICNEHHRILHWLMDQNLNWISHHKAIDKHEIRPVPLISDSRKPIQQTNQQPIIPKPPEENSPKQIHISGGEVTITF